MSKLTEDEKLMLCLFAFKTGCMHYNCESIKIAFENTDEQTKEYYRTLLKSFKTLQNHFNLYS